MTQQPLGVSLDDTFDILGDRCRRVLLLGLADSEPLRPGDVLEPDGNGSSWWVELRHRHLPRLEDAGFVEWDRETDELWRGRRFDEIRPALTLLADHADDRPSRD